MYPRRLLAFAGLTLLISWGGLLPELIPGMAALSPLLILVGFGPALSALVLTGREAGRRGVRELLKRLAIVDVGWQWYALVLLGPVALNLAGLGIDVLLGGRLDFQHLPVMDLVGAQDISPWMLLPFLFLYLVITLLGEEIGWRGYALPRLLRQYDPRVASLLLGLLWGIWHLPLAWAPSLRAGVAQLPLGWFLVDIVAMSFLFTEIFIRTKQSLLIATLLHAANNLTAFYLPLLPPATSSHRIFFILMTLKWIIVLALLMRHRPSTRLH